RFEQIYELVQMMMADGKIHEQEMDFCVDVATKLGFRKAIVGIVVRKIVIGLQESTPKEKIKDEAAVFLNFN
ncbi:MAG: TerB family tellurite resistance protein, partial [Cytophagales bacterium]|nr:TerB family tellurite resistance protein [Cytophagales bacterium]